MKSEESLVLSPKFGADGLITAVATDSVTGDVLMVAHMNSEALNKTVETRQAWYYSRSRARLWRKGETSGHTQTVVKIRIDCDQDCILMTVKQEGPACHTGRKSCFYREINLDKADKIMLDWV